MLVQGALYQGSNRVVGEADDDRRDGHPDRRADAPGGEQVERHTTVIGVVPTMGITESGVATMPSAIAAGTRGRSRARWS